MGCIYHVTICRGVYCAYTPGISMVTVYGIYHMGYVILGYAENMPRKHYCDTLCFIQASMFMQNTNDGSG